MSETSHTKERLKNLTPDQIKKLMCGAGKAATADFTAMPRNKDQVYPLSKAQERIWFLAHLYPNTPLYNIPLAVRLRSAVIDPDRLTAVINRIIRENDILRTTFEEKDGQIFQKVHPELKLQLVFEDISDTAYSADKEERVEQIGLAHGNALFNLATLPLLSAKLLKKSEKDYVLFFNLHHLISDGWTNSLLARDCSMFFSYKNDAADAPAQLNKNQYIDYVRWEQEWLKSARYQQQIEFWRKELAVLPDPFHFQKDFHSAEHSYEGRAENCGIPPSLHENVATYCQKNDTTPYQFYISCFALLLARYSDKRDLIIGTPVANRNQRHFQNTYGVFINSLPLRFRIDTSLAFREIMEGFKKVIRNCMNNQEVPFSEIINSVHPQRNLHENPLYNIHFAYQHFPQKSKDDEHALLPIDYRMTKFAINFWITIAGDERTINVSYQNKLICREKIKRFLGHFLSLVKAVVTLPDVPVRELDIISSEHRSILVGNRTPSEAASWLALFENSVSLSPEATAVVDAQGKMTYRTLDRHSSVIAHALTKKKVNKGDVVIVRTERNRNHVIAILACMKCGAAYLPVDNRIPSERFRHLLEDSKAKVVLTEKAIETVDCLEFEPGGRHRFEDTGFTGLALQGEDIAYIIYTSGSTGKPKGVCIPHRALVNYAQAMRQRINDSGIHSFAHVSALDADLGLTAIIMTLGFGGTLVIPAAETLLDPRLLADFFAENPVDAIKIVPAHLHVLREYLPEILPRKLLICAGDRLNTQLVSEIQQINPLLRIMNHYGPAETTISSLTFEVPTDMSGPVVPIGCPIDNSSVLLLDQDEKPVPLGTPGEICISGENVAIKYLNRPELTAKKFVHSSSLSSWPIYRTGDIGFMNKDGQVVFLDRVDRQVKVNGFRIELGELEAVIKAHAYVANAAVFVTDGDNGATKLHAAVEFPQQGDKRQISSYLAKYFPQPLIPVIFVVKAIPVTRNGKVDFELLRKLCAESVSPPPKAQPLDMVELRLAEIFTSVLNVPTVDQDDQFFDLGGHSLLAISLITKVNKAFHTQFPVATLFHYGSVRELASHIRTEISAIAGVSSPYVTLVNNEQNNRIVWVHPAGGNVMCYTTIAKALGGIYASKAFTAINHHQQEELSINGLAADYAFILKQKQEISGTVLAGWSMGALVAHDMAVLLAKEGKNLPLILMDQPVPHYGANISQSYAKRLLSYIERIEIFTGESIQASGSPGNRVDYDILHKEFIRLRLMPAEVSMGDFRTFLDVLVRHNNIIADFYPSIYQGPVLLLKASEKIMLKTSNPQPEYFLDDLGWRDFCQNLTIMEVQGNHITMVTGQYASGLGEVIHNWVSTL